MDGHLALARPPLQLDYGLIEFPGYLDAYL